MSKKIPNSKNDHDPSISEISGESEESPDGQASRTGSQDQASAAEASAPILVDLARVGIEVDWISELYTRKLNYEHAIPLLLHWLPRVENTVVKEALVRALSVSWGRPLAAPLLVKEFKNAGRGYSSLKWAIGNALSEVADESVLADLITLAQEKEHGKAREMLVLALGNTRRPEAEDLLIRLLGDDAVAGHAIMALGKIESHKAHAEIQKFLTAPKSWVRREAKKALARIEKSRKW